METTWGNNAAVSDCAVEKAMETDFVPFDWVRILLGEQPPAYLLEVAMKCVIVFCLLLLVMRLMGKRGQNNVSPMQQMLLIALGSAAGDVLLYPSVALSYAALVLVGITILTIGLETWSQRSKLMGGCDGVAPDSDGAGWCH